MSVLERFVRVRRFRTRANEYYDLAVGSFDMDVRKRYLAIADHYAALAETELRADRLERKRRLEELRAARAKKTPADRQPRPAQGPTGPSQQLKLLIIQGERHMGQRRIRLPARSNLTITKTAP
jgi:hypothetical protein